MAKNITDNTCTTNSCDKSKNMQRNESQRSQGRLYGPTISRDSGMFITKPITEKDAIAGLPNPKTELVEVVADD
ncbi:hypothetical protein CHS0354_003644 [Potamilus streckersoni]|uniref:Uncharacterized protein n=1 Tax=Potamilus streckersoni TaxID=2493646 RepID=A0AAE0S8X1_9BIVA|nr:hypothetical protein CHS0354_003644 [Potamilus streckersoni]